ncbi:tRNA (adenosine(37)-N6)-threonylcarbamoyltransferase complex ATPase subunit type 1 TsaE [Cerasicoccus fimbriatus]|uniref:tRNA (adenosine(37)-N6)-threonylcarbamoyltransferase complex ATPase subunit type 1 TsaE n=1 Tax=Cerasicoccus fimbriatus TaxID=3014554 RepID=UPI0022B5D506|nr:tRNA (adenosine(37)-N6)-threonylcarbamoyltransferase complex ATPase subunit type 1 TsaE [Cerasicoccus sp. TK19100]
MDDLLTQISNGVITRTPEDTEALARQLAELLPANSTIALTGDLGAGKSTFVRGLARAWGITQPVTSPTYNLLNVYQGKRQLLHLDAYRLDNPDAAEDLLIEDLQREPWVLAIEWPQKVPSYWLDHAWQLHLSISGEDRCIALNSRPSPNH